MSPLTRLRLLYHSLRHTRPGQLWARLRLMAMRKASVLGARLGLAPRGWYRAPAPAERLPADPRGPLFPGAEAVARPLLGLPATIDLVGTPFTLAAGMEWHPPALERGTRLELLNLHYMEYLPGLSVAARTQVVLDWIERNPPLRRGYWKDDWNSYALSIRVVVWMDLLSAGGLDVEPAQRTHVLQSLAAQLRFLAKNVESDIGGNHLIKNIRALVRGGRLFEGPEADGWLRLGARLLERELTEQVLPDGMHFELSPSYHLQVLGDLLDTRRALAPLVDGPLRAVRERLDEVLGRMLKVAASVTHPDGLPSLFADGGLHMTHSTAALLRAWALHGPRTPVPQAAEGCWSLPHAGYYGLRQGDDLLLVDCGPVGAAHLPAHGHGDALSFEWTVGGARVAVDAGVAEYHAGPLRAYSRSTRAHNTLTLDDQDQSEFWSAFRVARRAQARVEAWSGDGASPFRLVGSHDGYARGAGAPVHRRTFEAGPGRLSVVDEVLGGSGQEAVARLLLGPEVQVHLEPAGSRVRGALLSVQTPAEGALRGCTLHLRLMTTADLSVEPGVWMPDFGRRQEVQRLVLRYGKAPCRGEFTLTIREAEPADGGAAWPMGAASA